MYQTGVSTADSRCSHSSHQISQPCPTVHQDKTVASLLPGPIPLEFQDKVTHTLSCLASNSWRHCSMRRESTTCPPRMWAQLSFVLEQESHNFGQVTTFRACVAVDHSHINGNNPVTGHRFPLQRNTTTKSSTNRTPNHPSTTNEKYRLPTQATSKDFPRATLRQPWRHPC